MVATGTRNYLSNTPTNNSPLATTATATIPTPEEPARQPAASSSNEQNSSANDNTPPSDGLKNAVLGQLWLEIDEEIASSGASTYGVISTKSSHYPLRRLVSSLNRQYLV
jgi:hypothetical protein